MLSFLFTWYRWRHALPVLLLLLALTWSAAGLVQAGQEGVEGPAYIIAGRLIDNQNQPVPEAHITAHLPGQDEPLGETESQEDGNWRLDLEKEPVAGLQVTIERPHFKSEAVTLQGDQVAALVTDGIYGLGELQMQRRVTAGFWAATIIFAGVLALIALEKLHSTTAALAGISAVFLVSFASAVFWPDLYIINFERALTYINWEVIFLVMAMMIVIAVIEGTGIFQWTAFQAYRLSRGRAWVLVLILMGITALASALLDNFTTMLLMTPISLQIGLAIGINPLALIIPEVLASNVGGISTLIGTPTNILIGAHAGIGFTDFLVNQTAGVVAALIIMALYVLWHYRAEWRKQSGGISPGLYQVLEENARIEHPNALKKSGVVFLLVLVGFVIGERFHIVPAVPALIGATALLIWLKPDIHKMITAVDWTTLVFFMALFMVVGAVQEVGLISVIAQTISQIVGDSPVLAIFIMVFGVGTLSVFIANIPLAASMLPVADFLTATIPGLNGKALYYALSMGAAMGGNGSLVGAEANLVTAGITSQAGRPMAFAAFLKVGLPVTFLTLAVGFLWLLIRFAF
ncbi:MAG: ArsB/NhaD family transporter [Chloroflexota bacterium]|jgi:Na+/H+ antiporter NhaD/arsenite permease-like protein